MKKYQKPDLTIELFGKDIITSSATDPDNPNETEIGKFNLL